MKLDIKPNNVYKIISIQSCDNDKQQYYIYRCFLSAGFPSKSPKCSWIVETIFFELSIRYPKDKRGVQHSYVSRFAVILKDYSKIQNAVKNCGLADVITLPKVNETTLKMWISDNSCQDLSSLLGGCSQFAAICINKGKP